jgi:hypothetical protein
MVLDAPAREAQQKWLRESWDQHEAEWEAQLARLVAYKAEHGNCRVPVGWAEDPQLAKWVTIQRARARQLDRGGLSKWMTPKRVARLTAHGFLWKERKPKSKPKKSRAKPKGKIHRVDPKFAS